MNILIEMDNDCVERLLSAVMKGSAVYNVLQTGVRSAVPLNRGSLNHVVVVCDADDAEKIHQAAEIFCPGLAPFIRKEIDLYRLPSQ